MIKHYFALFVLILIVLSVSAQTDLSKFKSELATAADEAAALQIVNKYLPQFSSVEDLRELQNVWQSLDPQACTRYFTDAAAKEPKSATYAYLKLRFEQDSKLQYAGAIDICSKHPKFYWGYRLLSVNLAEMLINEEQDSSGEIPNKQKAFKLIDAGIKHYPDDAYLNLCQFHRYRLAGNVDLAEQHLNKVNDTSALYSNWGIVMDYIVNNKRSSLFEVLMPKMLADAVSKGQYTLEESSAIYNSQWLELQEKLGNSSAIVKFFSDNPQYKTEPPFSRYYENLLIADQQYDKLLEILSSNLNAGLISKHDLNRDTRYAVLYDKPQWQALLTDAENRWTADEPKRKLAALEGRMDKPAPLWELPDALGNMVKLSAYQGQIVVLDFWATWCNPCRMAMPALDKWIKNEMPAGVKVFSINVWEDADEEAKTYFAENKFAMTLLFAEDSISEEYGFSGIPYICVIDKQGKLAFAQAGYSEDLETKLSYWVEALAKE